MKYLIVSKLLIGVFCFITAYALIAESSASKIEPLFKPATEWPLGKYWTTKTIGQKGINGGRKKWGIVS